MGEKIPPRNPLAKIQLNINSSEKRLVEVAEYFGCSGTLNLKEIIVSRGDNLKAIRWSDFAAGKRSLELEERTTFRSYQLIDGKGQEILKIVLKRRDDGEDQIFYLREKKFLIISKKLLHIKKEMKKQPN